MWIAANLVEGTQEPWDSSAYGRIYLPAAFGLSLALGAVFPVRPWRWGFVVAMAQLPVMVMFTGAPGALIVVGVATLLIVSLPMMLSAVLGSMLQRMLRNDAQ